MRSYAVCNLKGGVGKTTSAVNIGASLARVGKRVLLVDCDPQCNLTNWLRANPGNGEPTLYEILRGQATVRSAAIATRWPGLEVVPASPKLHEIDRGALAGERVLWARMCEDYDFALFDCSAAPGVVLTNALTAADEVLAPVQAKGMALGGLERLQRLVDDVVTRGNANATLTGILVCLFDGRTRIARVVLGELRARYGELVFDTVVHENVKLSEAADNRRPITDYDPESRGAAEYAAIAFELMTRALRPAPTPQPAGLPRSTSGGEPFTRPSPGLAGVAVAGRESASTPASAHHLPSTDSHLRQD
ncbi:MAG: ParA family protein [Acidobacteriota bacterium]